MYTPKNDVGCPLHCLHVEEGYTGKLCYVTIPGGVPGNSFALPDVDVVCSKETATGLPRKRTRSSVLQAMGKEAFNKNSLNECSLLFVKL